MDNFISFKDVANLDELIDLALKYKKSPLTDAELGKGKRLGLLFMNPSLRTRVSTQIAAKNLGLDVVVLNAGQDNWSLEVNDGVIMDGHSVEHIKDAAPVLGAYFDIIGVRTFPGLKDKALDTAETLVNQLKKYSKKPVLSLESALLHPLQSCADLLTIKEHWHLPRKPKVVLTWAPHIKAIPHCVANSFCEWMTNWDAVDFSITHPKGMELSKAFTGDLTPEYDQNEALKEADFVYVKNWSSYENYGKMFETDEQWMLTEDKLAQTNDAKIMHCLPVRRNVELSDYALDHPNALVTEQATNRIWAAQAVLAYLLTQKA